MASLYAQMPLSGSNKLDQKKASKDREKEKEKALEKISHRKKTPPHGPILQGCRLLSPCGPSNDDQHLVSHVCALS